MSTAQVGKEIVRLCWEMKDLKALNAHIAILAKRRAQLSS